MNGHDGLDLNKPINSTSLVLYHWVDVFNQINGQAKRLPNLSLSCHYSLTLYIYKYLWTKKGTKLISLGTSVPKLTYDRWKCCSANFSMKATVIHTVLSTSEKQKATKFISSNKDPCAFPIYMYLYIYIY